MAQEKKNDKKKRSPKVHKSLRLSQENLDYLEKINQIKIKAGKKSSVANALDDLISSARKHKRLPTYEVNKTELNLTDAEKRQLFAGLIAIAADLDGIKTNKKLNDNNLNVLAKYVNTQQKYNKTADIQGLTNALNQMVDNYDVIYNQVLEMHGEVAEVCRLLSM